jgi:hypothetical protein
MSFKVTVMVEVATPSATTGLVPVIVEFAATGVPAVKTTVVPVFITGVRRFSVLVSAVSDLSVQVEIPLALVEPQLP